MVSPSFSFDDLFVLDLANNHQGSVEHGTKVIRAMGQEARSKGVKAGLKFQFRQLDTFIHPDHKSGSDNKHIGRFLSTRLMPADYAVLLEEVKQAGLISICTPFDEESVAIIEDLNIDVIKIASCSAKDWPLMERVAQAVRPIIISTGGLSTEDIDNLYSFFDHRAANFAFMHCVSIYPTPPEQCQLNRIDEMRIRYPGINIGWSTHEDPDDTMPVAVAVAKGASMFERHVGIPQETQALNAYSSTPEQVGRWMDAFSKARSLCGALSRPTPSKVETDSILDLQRGVYLRSGAKKGETLHREDVYFAMPCAPGQLSSGAWTSGIKARQAFRKDEALTLDAIDLPDISDAAHIKKTVHKVRGLIHEAKIALNSEFEVEFSHHYGPKNFAKVGAVIITCINRDYCKKLIVQIPGQSHPKHFHPIKEESFQVLHGELDIEVDGRKRRLIPGDVQLVLPGVWHSFSTETGCIFEEISTTHIVGDSVYQDPKINDLPMAARKTRVDHWGRYQVR
ncbi:MAG: N-acetylneuraminate synthase family protein [Rhodospirillales bacterium]